MRAYITYILIIFTSFFSLGQSTALDSLIKVFHTKYNTENKNDFATDTVFINYAHDICSGFLESNDLFNASKYNNIEQQLYEKTKLSSKNKRYLDRIRYRCVYARITILERKEGYNEALDLSFAILQTLDTITQKERVSLIEDEIGYIYYLFGNFPKALTFYTRSAELIKSTADASRIGAAYINLYGVYSAMGDNNTAIKYCFSALSCFKKINYKEGMRVAYGNLAMYYEGISADKALSYVLLSLQLRKGEIDYTNPGMEEKSLGSLYLIKSSTEKNQSKRKALLELSENNFKKALRVGEIVQNKAVLKDCYNGLAMLETEKKNFEKAYEYVRLYNSFKDSLHSEENSKASYKSLIKYEFNKKEQHQQLLLDKKEAIKQKELEKQRVQKNFFILGFILVSVFALFAFRSFKAKQKAHRIITDQKHEVEKQKLIIETKQLQLVQSITYAQRIQNNLLKSEADLQSIIPESFIIFKPRDIVSGDFYWFTKTENNDVIIVLGDCTGHGVPGALLSMIGITSLNEIVNHQKNYDPGDILNRLSIDVHDAFSKDNMQHKSDGMDFSVCRISQVQKKLYFAGVNQSLYVFNSASGLNKIEPQINSINGIFDINRNDKIKSEVLDLNGDSFFYLLSDGIIDQIGERTGKKYLSKRFEESLYSENLNETILNQKENIINKLDDWQGNYKQIDDISLIGFKI